MLRPLVFVFVAELIVNLSSVHASSYEREPLSNSCIKGSLFISGCLLRDIQMLSDRALDHSGRGSEVGTRQRRSLGLTMNLIGGGQSRSAHLYLVDMALQTHDAKLSDLLYAAEIELPFSLRPSVDVLPRPLEFASLFGEGLGVMQLTFRFSVRVEAIDSVGIDQMKHLAVDGWRKQVPTVRNQNPLTALRLCFLDKEDPYRLSDVIAAYGNEEERGLLKEPIGDVRVLVQRLEPRKSSHHSSDDESDPYTAEEFEHYSSDGSEAPRSSRSSSPLFDLED